MTTKQIAQAVKLQQEGLSIRQIATELDVDKNAVHRALKEQPASEDEDTPPPPKERPPVNPAATRDLQLNKLALDREHERELAKIELQRETLVMEKKKVDLLEQQVENDDRRLLLVESEQEEKENQRVDKKSNRKAKLLTEFKVLLKDLLDNCRDATWDRDEVEDYIDDLRDLQERVTKVTTEQGDDEQELAIWHNIEYLADLMQTELDEQAGDVIELDLDREERRELADLKVLDFDQAYEGDEDEENDDEPDHQPTKKAVTSQQQCVDEVNALVEELHEAIEEEEFWPEGDVDEFVEKVQDTAQKVRKLAKSLDLAVDSLNIVDTLTRLEDHMGECLEAYEKAQSSTRKLATYYSDRDEEQADDLVKINILDGEETNILEEWRIDEFDEELANEDDEDED